MKGRNRGIRRDTRVQIAAQSKMRYITSPLMNIFIELIYHSPLIPIRDEERKYGKEGGTSYVGWRLVTGGREGGDGKRSIFYCENQLTLIIDIRGISRHEARSMAIKTRSNCLWYRKAREDSGLNTECCSQGVENPSFDLGIWLSTCRFE